MATCVFDLKKDIKDTMQWNEEHLVCNPLITGRNGTFIKESDYVRKKGIYKLCHLLEEARTQDRADPLDEKLAKVCKRHTAGH